MGVSRGGGVPKMVVAGLRPLTWIVSDPLEIRPSPQLLARHIWSGGLCVKFDPSRPAFKVTQGHWSGADTD